ncbi:dihydroneopterin aldolase [Gardnerella vaginalis]|uniref:dihydroneopterin aldolase n=1 Tax=Gardnerella vaginalis TaxID=2702 RepID=UPI0035C70D2C
MEENSYSLIRLNGVRPNVNDIVIGLYTNIRIDAVLKVDLSRALAGNDTHAIDIPQLTDRLAFSLRQCEHDDEIEDHPSIALELMTNKVADSVMRTWQVVEADVTVRASVRSNYYGLQSEVDDVSVTVHRVAKRKYDMSNRAVPESIAHVAVRSGKVDIDDLEDSPNADYFRTLIEQNEEENKRIEDAEAAAAAQAAIDIANAAAEDYMGNSAEDDAANKSCNAEGEAVNADNSCENTCDNTGENLCENQLNNPGNEMAASEERHRFFDVDPLQMRTTLVISMRGVANHATRSAMLKIVALLEQDGETRVDGISALYVANALDGDYYTCVFLLSSTRDEYEMLRLVRIVSCSDKDKITLRVLGSRSYGAPATETESINPEGLPQEIAQMVTVDPKSPELMPWMQIESDAALDHNPLSYSLALALDTQTVGIYSDQWLLGDDY